MPVVAATRAQSELSMNNPGYMKGADVRQELSTPWQKMILIALPDKKVAWLIDPAKKTYMEARGEHVANITARTGLTIP